MAVKVFGRIEPDAVATRRSGPQGIDNLRRFVSRGIIRNGLK
jgi:hypothetical protein